MRVDAAREFAIHDEVWAEGIAELFTHAQETRRVGVHFLHRTEQQSNLALVDPAVDAALELFAPALDGRKTSAIAGAWAAVESLLCGPGDRANVEAADRLARIVACSFVRNELTKLAWEHSRKSSDDLAVDIDACADHRSRAALIETYIVGGNAPACSRPGDELAFLRMRKFSRQRVTASSTSRTTSRTHCAGCTGRQRNLVLHSGKTDAIAVDAALRTALPLVAAGTERIVAASVQQRVSAMELAARAKFAMDHYSSARTTSVVDLLQ